jgi:hypothetical protein
MKLFGREAPAGLTDLAASAAVLASSGDSHDRAAALNFVHDSRVSEGRAAHFLNWCRQTGNTGGLDLAAEEYVREQVQRDSNASFLHSNNGNNRVGSTDGPRGDDPLATVLDLTGLAGVLRTGRLVGLADLQALPAAEAVTDEQIDRFFEERLRNSDPAIRDGTVETILRAIYLSGRRPTWAAPWHKFFARIDYTPESWLQAVGIPRATPARWILVLRYTASEARPLVRPTQLEAGWFGYHYPSPPGDSAGPGGHAMSLRERMADQRLELLPEYIHARIPFLLSHWIAAGRLCGVTTSTVGPVDRLMACRTAHHEDLVAEYGLGNIQGWMP